MIQLTKKGKEIYGDYEIIITSSTNRLWQTLVYCIHEDILASNPTELKALIDLKLVEIV